MAPGTQELLRSPLRLRSSKTSLGPLLQQNPEAYNRNRFFTSSKNCFERWRFESTTVHACGFEVGILGRAPVAFGEALPAGTRLTLFSDDKPDRFFTVIKCWMDATSGVALDLETGVPTYQVEDEEGRTHLLIHLAIEEHHEQRWCLRRPDREKFDSRSIFEAALVEEERSRSDGAMERWISAQMQPRYLPNRCDPSSTLRLTLSFLPVAV
jgi:hypothetical protein